MVNKTTTLTIDLKKGRPQVLLAGNGLIRACKGVSWDDLISQMSTNDYLPKELSLPYIYRIKLVTENNVHKQIKKVVADNKKFFYGKSIADDGVIRDLLNVPFDAILTTNYSYELECAWNKDINYYKNRLSDCQKTLNKTGVADKKYLLHTFNQVSNEVGDKNIWHIHGEGRLPESIIIGNEEYGRLLNRIIQYASSPATNYNNGVIAVSNWLDYFILGDVYIVGRGMDYSEIDLWWLLDWKLKNNCGNVYFFEPGENGYNEKHELLKVIGCKVETCDMKLYYGNEFSYASFYEKATARIKETVKHNRS